MERLYSLLPGPAATHIKVREGAADRTQTVGLWQSLRSDLRRELASGGLALVDQLLCVHAAAFSGTHTSLFSAAIHERRQALAGVAAAMVEL